MEFTTLFKDLGYPVASSAVLGYALYKIMIYFTKSVYEPMQTTHFSLVTKLEASLDNVNKTQQGMLDQMVRVTNTLNALENKVQSMADNQLKTLELIDKLNTNMDELESRIKLCEVRA